MKIILVLGIWGSSLANLAWALDGYILVQASPSEKVVRPSSGNPGDKKTDSVVISTPKPRERVVPQAPQPITPIPVIIQPNLPQNQTNRSQ